MYTKLIFVLCLFSQFLLGQNNQLSLSSADQNRIVIPDNNSLNLSSNFSIEVKIQPGQITGQMVLIQEGRCNLANSSYNLIIAPDSTLRFTTNCYGNCNYANGYTCQTKIKPGDCLHISVVYSSKIEIYFNGVLQPGFYHLGGYCGTLNVSSDDLFVGFYESYSGNNTSFYEGTIDELRFWNKALTASEVLANYQNNLTGNEPSLTAYYKFDSNVSGPGAVIHNSAISSGAQLNGTTYSNTSITPSTTQSCSLPISISESAIDDLNLTIYPNPILDHFTIDWTDKDINSVSLKVFNSQGQLVKSIMTLKPENNVDISDLPSGVYYLSIESPQTLGYKKISKL